MIDIIYSNSILERFNKEPRSNYIEEIRCHIEQIINTIPKSDNHDLTPLNYGMFQFTDFEINSLIEIKNNINHYDPRIEVLEIVYEKNEITILVRLYEKTQAEPIIITLPQPHWSTNI